MNMCQWGWHWMGASSCSLVHHKWSRCFQGKDVRQNNRCYSCLPPARGMQLKCKHEWSRDFFNWQKCASDEHEQSRRHGLLSSETPPFLLATCWRKEVLRHYPQSSSRSWYTNMSEIWVADAIWCANIDFFPASCKNTVGGFSIARGLVEELMVSLT